MANEVQITQTEMSAKSGVDKANMSRYMSGEKIPYLDTARHIAETNRVPMDIFWSVETQMDYFGKVYLKKDVSYKKKEIKK